VTWPAAATAAILISAVATGLYDTMVPLIPAVGVLLEF
jgi:hypothetical protein